MKFLHLAIKSLSSTPQIHSSLTLSSSLDDTVITTSSLPPSLIDIESLYSNSYYSYGQQPSASITSSNYALRSSITQPHLTTSLTATTFDITPSTKITHYYDEETAQSSTAFPTIISPLVSFSDSNSIVSSIKAQSTFNPHQPTLQLTFLSHTTSSSLHSVATVDPSTVSGAEASSGLTLIYIIVSVTCCCILVTVVVLIIATLILARINKKYKEVYQVSSEVYFETAQVGDKYNQKETESQI